MKKRQRAMAVILAACLSGSLSESVIAAEPGKEETPKYDEQTMARLQDNALEYDELQLLIRERNPMMKNIWNSYEHAREQVDNMQSELKGVQRSTKDDMERIQEDMEKTTDPDSLYQLYVEYATQKALSGITENTMQGLGRTLDNFYSNRNTASLRQVENQIVSGAQSLMIGYRTVIVQRGILDKMLELNQKKVQIVEQQASLGQATQTDVLAAKAALLSAESSMANLASTQEKLRRQLVVMTGWSAADQPEIGPLPAPDLNRISFMNLEQDILKAIGNNGTLISLRNGTPGGATDTTRIRLLTVEEGEEKMKIKMQELYQNVMSKKAAYDTAQIAYQSALISQRSADTMYQQGMVSQADYIGLQLQYLQKMSDQETASIELLQAIETYDWAVQGVAELD